jgi:hypothetical protein
MRTKAFEVEFLKSLELLSDVEQERALAYIKSLLPKETNQSKLLRWAGGLDKKSVHEMEKAIEEGCENLEENAW